MMADGVTECGFIDGPIEVERTAILSMGHRVVTVKVGRYRVEITASPKGRNIHVREYEVCRDGIWEKKR